jgi:hypothetical protein
MDSIAAANIVLSIASIINFAALILMLKAVIKTEKYFGDTAFLVHS